MRNIRPFPEFLGIGMIFFVIVGVVCGVLVGTHLSLFFQVGCVVGIAVESVLLLYLDDAFHFDEGFQLETSAFLYIICLAGFIVGCVVGDISWVIQTGGIEITAPEFSNPFLIK